MRRSGWATGGGGCDASVDKVCLELQSFNLEIFMASKSMVSSAPENVILCCCHKPSGP